MTPKRSYDGRVTRRVVIFGLGFGLMACAKAPLLPPIPAGGASIIIEAPDGAAVQVDGVEVGEAPLGKPVDASPGAHHIVVTQNGYETYERDVVLTRDTRRTWSVELEPTSQRIASWVLLPIGAAGAGAGIVTGILAVIEQRAASDLDEDSTEYDDAVAAKDNYRVASATAVSVGLALFVTGALLLAFDAPTIPSLRPTKRGGAASFSF